MPPDNMRLNNIVKNLKNALKGKSHGGGSRYIAGIVMGAALIGPFTAIESAMAHEVMMTYVEHADRLIVGPSNIDITVALTFNELTSLEERKRMDRDRDGTINDAEVAAYLATLV